MAGRGFEGEGFWLPSEFLTDDDFLMDKENFNKSNKTESDSEFRFPTEFPYDSETQSDKLLQKFWMMAGSPQSTLAHHLRRAGGSSNGSPNGFLSPPTTPSGAKYDAVGDLIYLAAGEVAKLRMNRGYAEKTLSVPPRSHPQFYPEAKIRSTSAYLNTPFHQKQQNEGCGMLNNRQPMYQNRGGTGTAVEGMNQVAWALQQNPTRGRSVLFGGSGGGGNGGRAAAKRTCAGTGVFLPRRYENASNKSAQSSDSQRKPGRAPVHVHTKSFANVNGFTESGPQPQPRINLAFVPDYQSLMARRQILALQQRRNLLASLAEGSAMMSRDLYLPLGNSDISGLW
ncbi:hypothetical protein ACS0TY_000931 [Phlomoides rotata]